MKKQILFSIIPIIAISSPILIASSCDNVIKNDYFEKRAKETDEQIEKRYVNEYIQKENYIFDDFEQFKFNKEKHFRKNVDPNVLTLKDIFTNLMSIKMPLILQKILITTIL